MKKIRPDQKIVLVTGIGADMATAQAEFEEIGIDHVLPKPFSYDRVNEIEAIILAEKGEILEKEYFDRVTYRVSLEKKSVEKLKEMRDIVIFEI